MYRLLDLFSGIGGFSLGLERSGGFRTVAFCEIDPYCRKVLAKHWPEVPQYDDVRTLTAERLAADGIGVDAICGGFPCQDVSSAGKKVGLSGERSRLWREYARLIGELRPRIVIVENTAGLLARGMAEVFGNLAELGFDAGWFNISAADVGALHQRQRIWIVAYANDEGQSVGPVNDEARWMPEAGGILHAERRFLALGRNLERARREQQSIPWDRVWPDENSPMGMGVADGVPKRMDRLRALGNAVVPQIPELIGRAILASERTHAPSS